MDYQTQYQEYKALADAALNTYFADTTVSYRSSAGGDAL